ncbi:MAG: metallophosphoesterase [Cyclobacteriaceae bacterium]|nr:metallophosphoesterase [Cyclobacteriaceae bacterium]
MYLEWLLISFHYVSYLAFPFLILLIFFTIRNYKIVCPFGLSSLLNIALFFLTSVFIYSRFVERNTIKIQHTKIEAGFSAKIIVFSDMHIGVFKDKKFLEKVVELVNKQDNIDAVLIPGDFTYFAPENSLDNLFDPLRKIRFPVYAVLGNHDYGLPGWDVHEKLTAILDSKGVQVLHNQYTQLQNKGIYLLGLGDNWKGEDDTSLIDMFKEDDHLLVFTHNPDTFLKYRNNIADVSIAGHTHGGQIRVPLLYSQVIPCEGDFDQGLYKKDGKSFFVSSGLGEIGLPLRLGIFPAIDILELY